MVPLPLQTQMAAATNTPNGGKAGPNGACVVTGAAGNALLDPNGAHVVAATNTPNGACVVTRAAGNVGPNGAHVVAAGNMGPNGACVVAATNTPNGGKAGPNGACVVTGAAGNVGLCYPM
jgi:hypothetical protein